MNLSTEWVKSANIKNPFEVIYVNYPLTDNLVGDSTELCYVSDYETYFETYLKTKLIHLIEVRRIKFTRNDIKVSLNLWIEPEINIDLYKSDEKIDLNSLNSNLTPAYSDFIPINKAKYDDIKKLLNYIVIPESSTFYSDKYLKFNESETKVLSNNSENIRESSFCSCKGICIQKCLCKILINNKTCSFSCLGKKNLCKNIIKDWIFM